MKNLFKYPYKYMSVFSYVFFAVFMTVGSAYASNVSDLSENIISSASWLPGLVSAAAYSLGLLFGALGVLKLKDHVDSPQQTPLKEPVIRLFVGGALFALPIVYEAMSNTLNGGVADGLIDEQGGFEAVMGLLLGAASGGFNLILVNIANSFESVPGLISGAAYLLATVLGVSGILKIKEHVDAPQQVPLREGVIRLLTGGALFALPVVLEAMRETIDAGAGMSGFVTALINGPGIIGSDIADSTDSACVIAGIPLYTGLGGVICSIIGSTSFLPAFLVSFAYLTGLVLAVWGILKLKDHVLNPQQVPVWDGVVRLLAGGALFALPFMVDVVFSTVSDPLSAFLLRQDVTAYNDDGVLAGGLDSMMVGFMGNIMAPMAMLMNWFGYVVGTIFIIIGIMRLLKSSQEGPRGPGGIGTMATFIVGGALIAFSPMIGSLSTSLFGTPTTFTFADLAFTTGMDPAEVDHVNAVITAVVKFMLVLGMVSIMRGFFIVRDVAEGNQQASMMAAVTHLIGGALAVNIGPLVNAAQTTLGLAGFGINFG